MRVLITNPYLIQRSGTEMYVCDLARALQKRGHWPIVFVYKTGPLADEIRREGITVIDRLSDLPCVPDLIHGQGHQATWAAIHALKSTPAIYICHNHRHWIDTTPVHPRIMRYLGVSELCVERLRREGAPAGEIGALLNWVDTQRFLPRAPLPERPRRALVFSNYARADTHLPAVQAACAQANLALDVVGLGVNNPTMHPEKLLPDYDVVFAKAKAAMEAMAVGAAVILCDFGGVGPMVTPENFYRLQPLNFGFQALTQPLRPEFILQQLALYDAKHAAQVRDLIVHTASLEARVDEMVEVYRQTVSDFHEEARGKESGSLRAYRRAMVVGARSGLQNLGQRLPPKFRNRLKQVTSVTRLARRILPH